MNDTALKKLFARHLAGDRGAFGEIYEEMKRPIYIVLQRTVCDRELAQDLTQDLFVKLYTAPPTSEVSSPRAWIFRMARNLAIDALRKKKPTPMNSEEEDPLPDPSDRIADLEARLDLQRALSHLTPQQRTLLSLRFDADLSFGLIAQILGCSYPAAYRRYKQAIGALKQDLNGGNT